MEEESRKDSGHKMPFFEEITVMKTEIKEEYYDCEMSLEDMKSVNVKEEYISSPEDNLTEQNLGLVKSEKNRNIVSGDCKLRDEDLQKSITEKKNSLKRCILVKQDGESKKYKCADCKYSTHQKQTLERHIRTHTNDRPFKCTYKNCECTAVQEEYCKCSMCGYAATQNQHLKVHILRKHSAESKKHKCAYCKYSTRHKQTLMQHIRIHTNDRPYKCTYKNCECTAGQEESCKCSMCEYAAAQKQHLKVHILLNHSGEPKKYNCTHCKYSSHLKSSLMRHIHTHTNDRPFKCTYKNCECTAGQEEPCKCSMCWYAAAQKEHLRLHILRKHSAEPKENKCAYCKYATHKKSLLKQHMRIHTNERPFKCTYKNCECTAGQEESCKCSTCEYATAHKVNLKLHILTKHSAEPKKYKCADCSYATQKRQDLERHIRTHTNDRPFKCTYKNCKCTPEQTELCECSMCGYAAKQANQLKVHLLTKHSGGPKKYKCAHCTYSTHLKQTLRVHIRIHTNDRQFK